MIMRQNLTGTYEHTNFTSEQAGFRGKGNLSTDEQVLYISQDTERTFNRQLNIVSIFADFKDAYDSVCRYKLPQKLYKIRVKGNMFH